MLCGASAAVQRPALRQSRACGHIRHIVQCDLRCMQSVSHALCMQDASEQLKHAETREDGYSIIQTMLATLGAPDLPEDIRVHAAITLERPAAAAGAQATAPERGTAAVSHCIAAWRPKVCRTAAG